MARKDLAFSWYGSVVRERSEEEFWRKALGTIARNSLDIMRDWEPGLGLRAMRDRMRLRVGRGISDEELGRLFRSYGDTPEVSNEMLHGHGLLVRASHIPGTALITSSRAGPIMDYLERMGLEEALDGVLQLEGSCDPREALDRLGMDPDRTVYLGGGEPHDPEFFDAVRHPAVSPFSGLDVEYQDPGTGRLIKGFRLNGKAYGEGLVLKEGYVGELFGFLDGL